MANKSNNENTGWRWKRIFQYFLQGVLVTAPLGITIYIIYWFVSTIDSWITVIPGKDAAGNEINSNYGTGFIIIIVALIIIGYLSSNFITSKIFSLFDSWLERTPGIKFIYSSIRDFFEAFAGNKRKFNKAVLINVHSADVWQIGFITNEDAAELGLKNYITVYVPMSYSFAGITYIVPPDKVRRIEHISAGEALKYTISGGIADIEEEDG
ncbi:MAG: DUF502 domain-containing protein [Chitinophagaceae bacterium]